MTGATAEPVRVFVGTDRSQALAVRVLEHSIRRHTALRVEVHSLLDVARREPRDPRNWARTGFSFARFAIPALCGYRGKALYLDADMLVFRDIAELWGLPFAGAKVLIQEEPGRAGPGAPRARQSSVMLLDCERLDWELERILDGLDAGTYSYEQLLGQLCLLNQDELRATIPSRWNSLEHYDPETCLLHFTDMHTQPWVSPWHPLDWTWLDAVRAMLAEGGLAWAELEREVRLGYLRPSLLRDLRHGRRVPARLRPGWRRLNQLHDRARGFRPHREVRARQRRRREALGDAG